MSSLEDHLGLARGVQDHEDNIEIDSAQLVSREEPYPHGWTPYLLFCNVSAVIGSSFLFGYVGVMVNEPYRIFEGFLNASFAAQHNSTYLNFDDLDTLWTLTVSLFLIGGMVGALLGGPQGNHFGRRKSLLYDCFIAIAGGALMFAAPYAGYYELLLVGRTVTGIYCGLITGIVPAFITELAPISMRGMSGTVNQLTICLGGLTASILGLPDVLAKPDKPHLWPFLFAPCFILPFVQTITLLFTVESPRWLMLIKQDEASAAAALSKLRGKNIPIAVIEGEIDELRRMKEVFSNLPKLSYFESITGAFKWPLLICVMMQLTQQLSGINAAIFYSSDIFSRAGLSDSLSEYASLGVIATTGFMTLVSAFLVERLGRRSLIIIGVSGMMLSCVLLTVFMTLSFSNELQVFNILTIVSLILYVATFAVGPGPIPWFIAPELSLPQYRPTVISVCTFANWFANLAVGFGFPPMQKALGAYSFLPFLGTLTIFNLFAILFLPETRNRSPEEIIHQLELRRLQINVQCSSRQTDVG